MGLTSFPERGGFEFWNLMLYNRSLICLKVEWIVLIAHFNLISAKLYHQTKGAEDHLDSVTILILASIVFIYDNIDV